jgi:hypothetical protein
MDPRKSLAGHCRSRCNGFIDAVEIIPCDRLHIRPQDKVGVPLPCLELVFLGGMNSARDYLEDV